MKRNAPPEYGVWTGMRARCSNPKATGFANYGGRGISVCAEWDSFETFFADMGKRPTSLHTIDRIDNDGPYAPENCRWATRKEQQANRRNAVLIAHAGKTQNLVAWANELGMPYGKLIQRFARGMAPADILSRKNFPRGGYRETICAEVSA